MLCRVVVLACIVAVNTASAQNTPSQETILARKYNEEAKKFFNVGDFKQAAEAYAKAYRAKPIPAFLFNLGQCHKRLDGLEHLRKARFYYRSYLNNAPKAPNRQEVEEELVELEAKINALDKAADKTRQPAAAAPDTPPIRPTGLDGRVDRSGRSELWSSKQQVKSQPPKTPIYKRWWFWTVVGVVVVSATTATVVALKPDNHSPISGTMTPGETTLH